MNRETSRTSQPASLRSQRRSAAVTDVNFKGASPSNTGPHALCYRVLVTSLYHCQPGAITRRGRCDLKAVEGAVRNEALVQWVKLTAPFSAHVR